MNVPIRMLGIATSIVWVFLLVFIASAAFSARDIAFGVGEPQFTNASNDELVLTLPVYIYYRGYFSLKGFNLTTVFTSPEGVEISRASSLLAVVPQGQNTTILHNVTIANQHLFSNGNLTCLAIAGVTLADIVPLQLATNVTFPWTPLN